MSYSHRYLFAARLVLTLALLAGLFIGMPVTSVRAATITVPDNFATIQAAINAAHAGDTIIVRAGTYTENLTISKDLILTAASFDSNDPTRNTTIINAKSARKPVITIMAGLLSRPTVRGFIIRNGIDNITISSEAIIEYNYFIGSTDQLDFRTGGGGIVRRNVFFGSQDDGIDLDNMTHPLLIEHNRLMYNRDDGIEVRLQDASAPAQPITITIRNNEIIGCDEDGIQFIDYGQTVDTNRKYQITSNLIANCRFAGIGLMGNTISVENYEGANIIEGIWVYNNTIYGNDYGISGGDNLVAYNNIIANSTTRGVWRVQGPAGTRSVVAYTLFYNNGIEAEQSTLGGGNKFGQNPLFAYAPTAGPDGTWGTVDDNFRGLTLLSGSPAIDAGYDPVCPATDLFGAARPQGAHCDMGAVEGAGTAPPPTPIPVDPPVATNLISPSGNITSPKPLYTWNAVLNSAQGDAATWYLLRVKKADNTILVNQWYQASAVCSGNTCSTQHATALTGGVYNWEVQTWNTGGYGPWSSPRSFSLPFLPGSASLISPTGSITDTSPTFTWNVSPDGSTTDPATHYYLWVKRPSGVPIKIWYQAGAVCSGGTCSVTPAISLGGGAHTWWIQTWNPTGYGPWSNGMNFNLPVPMPPVAATLTSPSGLITATMPTYTWNDVPNSAQGDAATWYYLWVNGPSGSLIKTWYEASAVCSGGTCSVTPAVSLSGGAHTWWIRTWNSTGNGPWSSGMDFTVGP